MTDDGILKKLFRKDSDLPYEIITPLCEAVGGLVLAWGTAESSLHLIVVTAFDDAGGKNLEREFPHALKRKIRFLNKAFARLNLLNGFTSEMRSLLKEVSDLSDKRHGIIHAVATGFDADTGRVAFTSLDTDKAGHLIKISRHSILEMQQLSLQMGNLGGQLAELGHRVHEAVLAQKPSDQDTGSL